MERNQGFFCSPKIPIYNFVFYLSGLWIWDYGVRGAWSENYDLKYEGFMLFI